MEYLERVRETWRHHDLGDTSRDHVGLVEYAVMAASSHNTQPWLFELESGHVRILPDFSRRCPEVDPDDHHLYVSLGCAAENLLLAASAAGLEGRVSHDPSGPSLRVDFGAAPPVRSALFEAIPRRQCSRTEYDGSEVSSESLRRLAEAGRGSGVSVLLLTDRKAREQVAEYVAAGNAAQFGDPRWAQEMKRWIRFNARDAARTGDGLYGAVLGIPDVPRWFGECSMRLAVSAKSQSRKDHAHIRSSAAIAVFCSEADDWQHWAEAGRSYERFALQATALDLKTAFINQPVEVAAVRAQFAAHLGLGHRRPDLVVRIGRGPESPRSLRRPVNDVLLRACP
jgi:nitroreductase